MKIALCVDSLVKGGAERVIANLANFLVDRHEVKILLLDKVVEYPIDKRVFITAVNSSLKHRKPLVYFERLRLMKNYFKDTEADVVVSFLPRTNYWVLASAPKYSKVVMSERNDPKIIYRTLRRKLAVAKLYPKAKGFVFQTKEAQEYYEENKIIKKGAKKTIILNPVDPSFLVRPFDGERKKEIVTMGRLSRQKGQADLIKAFARLKDDFPEFKLYIYGEGPLRKELEELIRHCSLEGRVFLPGKVDDVRSKTYKATAFVLPSLFEGMPNALLEALVMGVPSISTDCPCGGPKSVILNGENGLLVPVGDIEKLEEAMRKVISSKELQRKFSDNSEALRKKLDPKVVNAEWESFLQSVSGIV